MVADYSRFRGGPAYILDRYVGSWTGEVIFDTTNNCLRIYDGVTTGGRKLSASEAYDCASLGFMKVFNGGPSFLVMDKDGHGMSTCEVRDRRRAYEEWQPLVDHEEKAMYLGDDRTPGGRKVDGC